MAFTVTPTSGEPPYTFTADINSKMNIDNVHYALEFRTSTSTTSCPVGVQSGSNQLPPVNALLNTGTFIQNGGAVPVGSCKAHSLIIVDLSDNSVIDYMNVDIDNI